MVGKGPTPAAPAHRLPVLGRRRRHHRPRPAGSGLPARRRHHRGRGAGPVGAAVRHRRGDGPRALRHRGGHGPRRRHPGALLRHRLDAGSRRQGGAGRASGSPDRDVRLVLLGAASRRFEKGWYRIDREKLTPKEVIDHFATWIRPLPGVRGGGPPGGGGLGELDRAVRPPQGGGPAGEGGGRRPAVQQPGADQAGRDPAGQQRPGPQAEPVRDPQRRRPRPCELARKAGWTRDRRRPHRRDRGRLADRPGGGLGRRVTCRSGASGAPSGWPNTTGCWRSRRRPTGRCTGRGGADSAGGPRRTGLAADRSALLAGRGGEHHQRQPEQVGQQQVDDLQGDRGQQQQVGEPDRHLHQHQRRR